MNDQVRVLAVVPLRLKSTRVKEKILANLGDAKKQRPLCVWVCERVLKAFEKMPFVQVLAAVDDIKTKNILEKFLPHLKVYLTDPELPSGTDRVFAGAQGYLKDYPHLEERICGIVNIQGDMPFVGARGIQEMAQFFNEATKSDLLKAPMLTLCQEWPTEKNSPKLTDASAVKVLLDRDSFAIYFSRFAIPYSRVPAHRASDKSLAKFHLGVYGYTIEALARFCASAPAPLEQAEGLEQLRALWLGMPILVFPTECNSNESYRGVDTARDILWARNFIKQSKTKKKAKRK